MSATARTIVTNAMLELGILSGTETASGPDAAFVLSKLCLLYNGWNAFRPAVFCMEFTSFTLVPSTGTYTLGPTGAFVLAQRPVTLDGCNIVLTDVTPNVRNPMNPRDWQWWQAQSVRSITSSYPTDFYYKPSFPNGQLNVWPVPTVAYGIETVTRNLIDDTLSLDDVIDQPPGYQNAVTLTLAEDIAGAFGKSISAILERNARQARALIYANNDFTGSMATVDAGMPSANANAASWNYKTGLNFPSSRGNN